MNEKFEIGAELESGKTYIADRKRYDIYPEDAKILSGKRYVGLRGRSKPEFPAFIAIRNKKDITLDFDGATIVLHGKIQPFVIEDSCGITIKNCTVRNERPMFTELSILERHDGLIKVRPNKNCPCKVCDGKLIPYDTTWENDSLDHRGMFFQVFDPVTCDACGLALGAVGKTFIPDPTFPFDVLLFEAKEDTDGDIILYGKEIPDYYQPGRVISIEHERRDLSSVYSFGCEDLTIENYRILSGFGMGLFLFRTKNITIDGFRLYHDESSPCIVTNSSDALHTFACSGSFVIRNSVFEGMMDDAINIHGNFHTVECAENSIITANIASVEAQAAAAFGDGDNIAVYRGATLEKTAEYKIISACDKDDGRREFTVDRPVSCHSKGDLIENLSGNADITIENCRFANANTHLRLQSRGKVRIHDCVLELPILLTGDASYWFESSPIRDIEIKNNRFTTERAVIRITSEILPTEKEPYYHKNIKVSDNEFVSDSPLSGGYADGIVFTGNKNTLGKKMTLELTECGSAVCENCEIIRKSETKTKLGIN